MISNVYIFYIHVKVYSLPYLHVESEYSQISERLKLRYYLVELKL